MHQEILPCRQGRIDSVKSNPPLKIMIEWSSTAFLFITNPSLGSSSGNPSLYTDAHSITIYREELDLTLPILPGKNVLNPDALPREGLMMNRNSGTMGRSPLSNTFHSFLVKGF